MKKLPISILIMCVSALLYSSCSNEVDTKPTNPSEKEISKEEPVQVDPENFPLGSWRIDSVGENRITSKRIHEEERIQVFHFRKDGRFSVMDVDSRTTEDRIIGTWKVEKDSVFVLGEKGQAAMRFAYKLNGSVLTLDGSFDISAGNGKKPSFYLSRYVAKRN